MYLIHLKGNKKAVLIVCNNLVGYGTPEIVHEEGNDEEYIIHCELDTKHDAIPNQHLDSEAWDGSLVDLSEVSLDDIKNGKYDDMYIDHEIEVLSGMFNVQIELLNDPDDKWWEDAELDPQYPFYAYTNGKESTNTVLSELDTSAFSF